MFVYFFYLSIIYFCFKNIYHHCNHINDGQLKCTNLEIQKHNICVNNDISNLCELKPRITEYKHSGGKMKQHAETRKNVTSPSIGLMKNDMNNKYK